MLVVEQATDVYILIMFWTKIWIQDLFFVGGFFLSECSIIVGVWGLWCPHCLKSSASSDAACSNNLYSLSQMVCCAGCCQVQTCTLHFLVVIRSSREGASPGASPLISLLLFLCRSHGSFSASSSRPTLSSTRGKCHSFFKVRVFTPNWRVSLILRHYI